MCETKDHPSNPQFLPIFYYNIIIAVLIRIVVSCHLVSVRPWPIVVLSSSATSSVPHFAVLNFIGTNGLFTGAWLLLVICYDNIVFYIAMTTNCYLHIYLQSWETLLLLHTHVYGFTRNLQLSLPCQMLMGILEIRESKGMRTFSTIWYKLFPAFVQHKPICSYCCLQGCWLSWIY